MNQKCDESCTLLVLESYAWSVLTWPLIVTAHGRKKFFSMDPNGSAACLSMFEPEFYEVIPGTIATASDGWICLESSYGPQPFLRHVMESWSKNLSFAVVSFVAEYLKCVEGKAFTKSRATLLRAIADHFGLNSNELLAHDSNVKTNASSQSDDIDAEFVDEIFEAVDNDERQEYRSLREKVKVCHSNKKKQQWSQWLKEKKHEVQVSCMTWTYNCFFCMQFEYLK